MQQFFLFLMNENVGNFECIPVLVIIYIIFYLTISIPILAIKQRHHFETFNISNCMQ